MWRVLSPEHVSNLLDLIPICVELLNLIKLNHFTFIFHSITSHTFVEVNYYITSLLIEIKIMHEITPTLSPPFPLKIQTKFQRAGLRVGMVHVSPSKELGMEESGENRLTWLRSQVIGRDTEFNSPFGRRRLTYADHTASGRCLRYVEDFITDNVLPFYGKSKGLIQPRSFEDKI